MDKTQYHREYRAKNRDKVNRQQLRWVEDNAEKVQEYQKRYRDRNREEINRRNRLRKHGADEASPEAFLRKALCRIARKGAYCHEASRRKYEQFDLTLEHLMNLWHNQQGCCALTGKRMVHKFNSLFAVSVDRIQSSRGYLQDNVQLVCQAANYAKNRFTNEEFLKFWQQNKED